MTEIDHETCDYTGVKHEECPCLICHPRMVFTKWICTDCKTIDDVINTLEEKIQHYTQLKAEGWIVDVEEAFILLWPPDRDGFFWVRCSKCDDTVLVQEGVKARWLCEACRGKVDVEE